MKPSYYLLMAFTILLGGCKKKNSDSPTPGPASSGDETITVQHTTANVLQVNKVNVRAIDQDSVVGKIGNQSVVLYKLNDTTLTYLTPPTVPTGSQVLSFSLNGNNFTASLTILDTVDVTHPQTQIDRFEAFANKNVQEMNDLLQAEVDSHFISQTEKDAEMAGMEQFYADAFNKIKSFNEADQVTLAKFWGANAGVWRSQSDANLRLEALSPLEATALKFGLAIYAMGASVWIAYTYPDPLVKLGAAIVCYQSFKRANYYGDCMVREPARAIDVFFDEQTDNQRLESITHLDVTNKVPYPLSITVTKSTLSMEDKESEIPFIHTFFANHALLASYATKLNQAIDWINAHLPFTNTSFRFDAPEIPQEPTKVNKPYGDARFLHVSNENASIRTNVAGIDAQNASLTYVYEKTHQDPITFQSTITYDDGLSSFSKELGITLRKESIPELPKWVKVPSSAFTFSYETDGFGSTASAVVRNDTVEVTIRLVPHTSPASSPYAKVTISATSFCVDSTYIAPASASWPGGYLFDQDRSADGQSIICRASAGTMSKGDGGVFKRQLNISCVAKK